jgi:dienelactone hydrolase
MNRNIGAARSCPPDAKEETMNRIVIGFFALVLALATAHFSFAEPRVTGEKVTYSARGTVMEGYLAYDRSLKGKRPGVLVVHEWWGLNDYARRRALMLADLGYVALAVDMYGGDKVAAHPEDAAKLSSELMKNFAVAGARFQAAMDLLRQHPAVDPARIAAIGYCFGGGIVLNVARQGADMKGVASFHGNLTAVRPAQPGAVKAKILVLNGAADKFVTPEQIDRFKGEMKVAGADFRFISYPGALHSFTNPEADEMAREFNLPIGYNARADRESWEELKKFLKEVFGEQ